MVGSISGHHTGKVKGERCKVTPLSAVLLNSCHASIPGVHK